MDEVKTTTDNEQKQLVPDESKVKYAYVVGVNEETGQFIFDVTGDDVGVVELMGLHAYASTRIKNIVDANQGFGDAISMQILNRLDSLTSALQQLLTGGRGAETQDTGTDKENK